ncbi:MAG: hypothetical protein V4714_07690 [Bacteroidota bacterium]
MANHIFSGKLNKFVDNPANRALISDLTNNSGNLLGTSKYGVSWYARTIENGTQIYGYTQNSLVKGAGINPTPIDIFKLQGLK